MASLLKKIALTAALTVALAIVVTLLAGEACTLGAALVPAAVFVYVATK